VSFTYRTRPDRMVLRAVSVRMEPGAITCFVGESGSGKSTFAALLSGLYRPCSGSVWIGGRRLGSPDEDPESVPKLGSDPEQGGGDASGGSMAEFLHRNVGVVEQSSVTLLSGTIAFNIGYGKMDATQAEIEAAAKKAFAHDFIVALPQGYLTEMGVGGGFLSGGQRARVAIARALVKDPACLLLDEVTAALDSNSEAEVIKVLCSLRGSKTIVVMTHSPALQQIADAVYCIQGGSCKAL